MTRTFVSYCFLSLSSASPAKCLPRSLYLSGLAQMFACLSLKSSFVRERCFPPKIMLTFYNNHPVSATESRSSELFPSLVSLKMPFFDERATLIFPTGEKWL